MDRNQKYAVISEFNKLKRINPKSLTSKVFSLEKAAEAFDLILKPSENFMGLQLNMIIKLMLEMGKIVIITIAL